MKSNPRIKFARLLQLFMILAFSLTPASVSRAAGPWYVAPGGEDSNTCLSPASACATINGAITKAQPDDTVYVAMGEYLGGQMGFISIVLINKNIILSGGWNDSFTTQDGFSDVRPGSNEQIGLSVTQGVTADVERFNIEGDSWSVGGVSNSGTLTLRLGAVSGRAYDGAGGIYNEGHLELQHVDVSGTSSGGVGTEDVAIDNTSSVTFINGSMSNGLVNSGDISLNNVNIQNGHIRNNGTAIFTTVTISNSTSGGLGPVVNLGTLTLENCDLNNNNAFDAGGAVYNSGSLIINNSILRDNYTSPVNSDGDGGAIYNIDGSVTLSHSTIANNQTHQGGGIYISSGSLIIIDSAIVDNVAETPFWQSGGGGGINVQSGVVNIDNSTISSNQANHGGAIYVYEGSLSLNNTTIAYNVADYEGALYNHSGSVTTQNSLFARNRDNDCTGSLTSAGYNLFEKPQGCSFTPAPGDLSDVHASVIPLLYLPSPPYNPLSMFSGAIDAGNPAGCTDHSGDPLTADQRGVARVGICDIGAYEFDPTFDPLHYLFLTILFY